MIFFAERKWWKNDVLALTTAGLAAVSSLTFQFAIHGSNQNFIPLFVPLFFFALERVMFGTDYRVWHVALLTISFGVVIQLHLVSLICLSVILGLVVLRRQLRISGVGLMFFGFIVLLVNFPVLSYKLTHTFPSFGLQDIAVLVLGADDRSIIAHRRACRHVHLLFFYPIAVGIYLPGFGLAQLMARGYRTLVYYLISIFVIMQIGQSISYHYLVSHLQ